MKSRSVVETLSPLLIVSRLLGAFTLFELRGTLMLSKTLQGFVFVVTVLQTLHLISIPNALIYIEKNITNTSDALLPSQHFVTKVLNQMLVGVVGVASRCLFVYRLHRYFPKIVIKIDWADGYLDYKNYGRDWWHIFIVTISIALLCLPFQVYSIVTMRGTVNVAVFLINLSNILAAVCSEAQFVVMAILFIYRYDCLNRRIYMYQALKMKNSATKINRINEIRLLGHANQNLVQGCKLLATLYGPHLLISISSCFLNALFNLYYAMFGGLKDTPDDTLIRPICDVINDALWGGYYFVRIAAVCLASGTLTQQANATKQYLSELIQKSESKPIKEELNLFLDYCCINQVKFTACGFFKINKALITTIVGSGATYLVILAQFHKGA